MIAGLEDITDGELYIDDRLVNDVAPKDRDIAMVFQNYALYPHMTIFDNMAFALKLRKFPKSQIKEKVEQTAKLLNIVEQLDKKPKQLSGGQRQRVALGRAIVRNPEVFLFDEPLSNLDAKMRVQMRTEILKLHHHLKSTMIYVTHDQVEAMTMGSKIVVMNEGIVQQVDTPLNVYNNPVNVFVAGFIGSPAMNFITGELSSKGEELYFRSESVIFQIPPFIAPKLMVHKNKKIIFGIRPEDIYDARFNTMAEIPVDIDSICELVEPLGNEYMVYVKVGELSLTARFDPKQLPEIDKPLEISFDLSKGHFFSTEGEQERITEFLLLR
jgi:multiple sugar transport system ATP-binding protein